MAPLPLRKKRPASASPYARHRPSACDEVVLANRLGGKRSKYLETSKIAIETHYFQSKSIIFGPQVDCELIDCVHSFSNIRLIEPSWPSGGNQSFRRDFGGNTAIFPASPNEVLSSLKEKSLLLRRLLTSRCEAGVGHLTQIVTGNKLG